MNLIRNIPYAVFLCLVFLLLFMGGCSPEALEDETPVQEPVQEEEVNDLQVESEAFTYENNRYGLAFNYLEGWTLQEEEKGGSLYLTLALREEGSDSARIIISVIPDESLSPETVLTDLLNTLGEVEVKADNPGARIREYAAHYFEAATGSPEPLRVTAYILQEKGSTFIFTCMAREEQAEASEEGFMEVLTTLEMKKAE